MSTAEKKGKEVSEALMLKLCLAGPWVGWADKGVEKWKGPSYEKKLHM